MTNKMMDSVVVTNEGKLVENEMMDSFCCDERFDGCMDPEIKVTCHRTFNASLSNAHHVSYLSKSKVDSKGVHHVGDSGSGWKRVSAIMDSGC